MIIKQKGTILITTLWILALLTLLALGVGIRMGVDVKLIGFYVNSAKAHYLAEAGIRKTISLIEGDSDSIDALNEPWACGFRYDEFGLGGEDDNMLKEIELGEGTFTVVNEFGKDGVGNAIYLYGASDEEGRLNINKLDQQMLQRLPNLTSDIVAAILDWRDENDIVDHLDGAETEYYKGLENGYECKDADFSVPEELLLVRGITPEIYSGMKDIITVYGNHKKININTT